VWEVCFFPSPCENVRPLFGTLLRGQFVCQFCLRRSQWAFRSHCDHDLYDHINIDLLHSVHPAYLYFVLRTRGRRAINVEDASSQMI
jgi:hypothetical protein